jgi:hypothetical protein
MYRTILSNSGQIDLSSGIVFKDRFQIENLGLNLTGIGHTLAA